MANVNDETRRWEVICVDSADGEYVVYVEGKDSKNVFWLFYIEIFELFRRH